MTSRLLPLALAAGLALTGCAGREPRRVATLQSAGHTIELATTTGQWQSGANDVTVSFHDASGRPVEVQAASLRFYMPPMGAMAAMVADAPLKPTDQPGVLSGRAELSMKGSWQATLTYQATTGSQRATFNVMAQ